MTTVYSIQIDGVEVWANGGNMWQKGSGSINPSATFQFNKTEELQITLTPKSLAYDSVRRYKSRVIVFRDSKAIFVGRPRSISTSLNGNKKITFEGPLAFFIDTYLKPDTKLITVREFFRYIIQNHNEQGGVPMTVGDIENETADVVDKFVVNEFVSTQDVVREFLNRQKARIEFEYSSNGAITVHLRKGRPDSVNTQALEVKKNIVDFNRDEADDVWSAILPVGQENTVLPELIIPMPDAVDEYGSTIVHIKKFDTKNLADLRAYTERYISLRGQIVPPTLRITGLDMSNLDLAVETLRAGDFVTIKHSPMSFTVDKTLIKIDFNFVQPYQSTYEFAEYIDMWDESRSGESSGGYGWSGDPDDLPNAGYDPVKEAAGSGASFSSVTNGIDNAEKSKTDTAKNSTSRGSDTAKAAANADNRMYLFLDNNQDLGFTARDIKILYDGLEAQSKKIDKQGETLSSDIKANADRLEAIWSKTGDKGLIKDYITTQLNIEAGKFDLKLAEKASIEYVDDQNDKQTETVDAKFTTISANVDGLKTRVGTAEGNITTLNQTATEIKLEVGNKANKNAIIELINSGAAGEIKIKADKVAIDGDTLVDWLEGRQVDVHNLNADGASIDNIDSDVAQARVLFGEELGCSTLNGQTCNVCSFLVGGQSVGSFFGPGDISINLSDLPGYEDAIKAARKEGADSVTLSGFGWINGEYTVTATSPYTGSKSYDVSLPPFSVSGGDSWTSDNKTTVNFSTQSVGVPLGSKTVDATPLLEAVKVTYCELNYMTASECRVNITLSNGKTYSGITVHGY